jgi:hypothetical protein
VQFSVQRGEVAQVRVRDLHVHYALDEVRGHHHILHKARQRGLRQLAVLELHPHAQGLLLQALDLAADGPQVRLEAAQERLHVAQDAIAVADLGVQRHQVVALADVVLHDHTSREGGTQHGSERAHYEMQREYRIFFQGAYEQLELFRMDSLNMMNLSAAVLR